MSRRYFQALTALALAAALSGCASLPFGKSKAERPSTESSSESSDEHRLKQQAREFSNDFSRKRDQVQYDAALSRWQADNPRECREILSQLLARNPHHAGGLLLRADIDLAEGTPAQSIESIEALQTREPKNARAHHVLGLLLEADNRPQEAVAHFLHATTLAPDEEMFALSHQRALESSKPKAKPTSSVPAMVRDDRVVQASAVETETAGSDTTSANVQADAAFDRQWQELQYEIAARPDDPEIPIRAAVLALRNARTELAVQVLGPAADRFAAHARFQQTLGLAYYRHGRYDAAARTLRHALSLDSVKGLSYFLLGCTLREQGDAKAADECFAEARRLDARYADATAQQ